MITGAVLSADEDYRYSLWRHWGAGAERVVFVMLNPSTADADEDDPTIRRCVSFGQREGFDGLEVLNLYALRATDPKVVERALGALPEADVRGPDNDWHWERVLSVSGLVILGWGAKPFATLSETQETMLKLFERRGGRLTCLGLTKDGRPGHPLYLKSDAPLRAYPWSSP